MTITRDKLNAACRAHDNAADTGATLPEILAKRGVDVKDAMYVAEQRALRIVLHTSGRPAPDPTKLTRVELSAQEQHLLAVLMSTWIDGFAVGIKATE